MSRLLLRFSSRQLSQAAALPLRSAPRQVFFQTFRLPRTLPRHTSLACFSHHTRLYSSSDHKPPPAEKKDTGSSSGRNPSEQRSDGGDKAGDVKDAKASATSPDPPEKLGESRPAEKQESEPPVPLQPEWVFLTSEEIEGLIAMMDKLPVSQRKSWVSFINLIEKHGAPPEIREMIYKQKANLMGWRDWLSVTRIAYDFLVAIGEHNAQENEKELRKQMFNSQEPRLGKGSSPEEASRGDQQQQQKQQQGQQEAGREPPQGAAGPKNQQTGGRDPKDRKGGSGGSGWPGGNWTSREMATWIVATLIVMLFWDGFGAPTREITWQELRAKFLEKGLVEKFIVEGDRVRVQLNRDAVKAVYGDQEPSIQGMTYYFSIGSVDSFERKLEAALMELGVPQSESIPISYSRPSGLMNIILAFGPTLLLVGLLVWAARGRGGQGGGIGGPFNFGKSRAQRFNHETAVKVKFSDVAGMDEAKLEIVEFVSFLKTPEKFQRLGAKIPRGAILSGPPGTGKTLLAKATAGESNVPFFSVSGSEFVEMFVGVGASRVRDLFAEARKNAPCIIFIDEIDAIGKSRDGGQRFGGNDEREATLNQILTEMDGFNTQEQVVVLAGTNRPDILDKALMRPGRFDRHINIDRPTMKGRADIFRVHLAKIFTKEDMDYLCGRLAALTPGFAGADIANVVNEAALVAARANAESVSMVHFEQAVERVIGGLERKSLVLSPEEKRTVAYHEAGHAICGWYFRYADPLLKVSIIPRGQGALGYAQYLPAGDAYLMNVNQLMDRMAMILGGRISEELHFPTVTSGASDDFRKVTQLATTMVTQWGMSEKLGPLHFNQDQNQLQKPFAESTAQTIDAEVRRIVDDAYKQCKDLLTAKKKEIGIVAEELLRKEQLTRDDLVRLLGPRPFPDKEEFAKYFNNQTGEGGTIAPAPFPSEREGQPPPDGAEPVMYEEGDRQR